MFRVTCCRIMYIYTYYTYASRGKLRLTRNILWRCASVPRCANTHALDRSIQPTPTRTPSTPLPGWPSHPAHMGPNSHDRTHTVLKISNLSAVVDHSQ